MKKFKIIKHYNYAEIFIIEAIDEKKAVEYLENDSSIEPNATFEDFDFYDVEEELIK